jgi:hypothetical protein
MVKLMMMEVSEETGRRMLNCPTSANGIHLAVASNNDGSDAIVWVGVRTTSSEGTETIHMLKPVKVAADSVVQDLRRGVIRAFAPSLDEVAPNHLDLYYGDAVLAPNAPLALYEATETNPLWLSPQVLLGTGTSMHFSCVNALLQYANRDDDVFHITFPNFAGAPAIRNPEP